MPTRALTALLALLIVNCKTIEDWPDAGSDADADVDVDDVVLPDADPQPDADDGGAQDADEGEALPDADIGGGDAPLDEIPRVWEAPTIDGHLSEWPGLRYLLDGDNAALRYGPDTTPTHSDAYLEFDLRWSPEALYFGARLYDDLPQVDSTMVWQDDSVELYVDGDNNDELSTYDANDHQYTIVRDGRIADRGEVIDGAARGLRLAVVEADDGSFTVELAVPWSELAGQPVAGQLLGIDVAFNDDDDGADEDTHLVMWLDHPMTGEGSPVQDTTLFRDLRLGE